MGMPAAYRDLRRASRLATLKAGWAFFGVEILLDSDVHLLRAALEPAASASAQLGGLFRLRQAQQLAVKFSRRGLAAGRGGKLHVIEGEDAEGHEGSLMEIAGCLRILAVAR